MTQLPPINPNRFGALLVGEAEERAVLGVLRSKELFRFRDDGVPSQSLHLEQELGARLKTAGAVAVSNGTAALRAALHAAGVQRGDRVAIPAFTFVATASSVVSLGAIPEPVDVDVTLGMAPDLLATHRRGTLRAVVPVHIQGRATNVEPIAEVARTLEAVVVEDACQGLGAQCFGTQAGTTGALGAFSFQLGKQLSSGEGGAVVAADSALLDRARRFSDHGADRAGEGPPRWNDPDGEFGENLRMTELEAALLRVQLSRLDDMLSRQRAQARLARAMLGDLGMRGLPSTDPGGDTGSHLLFVTRTSDDADAVIATAAQDRVLVRRIWPTTYYDRPAFRRAGLDPSSLGSHPCRVAESLAARVLTVPLPPTLSQPEVGIVVRTLGRVRHLLCEEEAL